MKTKNVTMRIIAVDLYIVSKKDDEDNFNYILCKTAMKTTSYNNWKLIKILKNFSQEKP